MDKVARLNYSHSIFFGTISSILYEAAIADHTVASLIINIELINLSRKYINFKSVKLIILLIR